MEKNQVEKKLLKKKEVFNIIFKEEIAAEKKRVEAIEEAKRQEELTKSKIYISDVKQVDSSYIPKIQFTLNNPTNMTISYIKFDISRFTGKYILSLKIFIYIMIIANNLTILLRR